MGEFESSEEADLFDTFVTVRLYSGLLEKNPGDSQSKKNLETAVEEITKQLKHWGITNQGSLNERLALRGVSSIDSNMWRAYIEQLK